MSFRTWLYVFAIGVAIVVIGALFWTSFSSFSTYKQGHSNERNYAAQYYANATQESAKTCGAIMGESGVFDWLTCLAENVGTDGSVKQAEYDLKAQQEMAEWAFGMLIVTIWIAVITLAGVFFVGWTLFATRRMAADTRDIGEAQARAYISGEIIYHGVSRGSEHPVFSFKVTNTGASPANYLSVAIKLNLLTFGVSTIDQWASDSIGSVAGKSERETEPVQYLDIAMDQSASDKERFLLSALFVGVDVFGKIVFSYHELIFANGKFSEDFMGMLPSEPPHEFLFKAIRGGSGKQILDRMSKAQRDDYLKWFESNAESQKD